MGASRGTGGAGPSDAGGRSTFAGRENGYMDAERASVVRATVRSYRERMRHFAGPGNLAVWYTQVDMETLQARADRNLGARGRERTRRTMAKARSRDSLQASGKLTQTAGGRRRIVPDPPLIVPLGSLLPGVDRDDLEEQLRELIERYSHSLQSDRRHLLRQYRLVDMARKVVGVGSVGTRCWIILPAR
ncbi:DUF2252 family protein [Streptomyces sp. Qhu-G9]|uniref:DUF2252 family protein n=1 Tax=Streptomyces sp. Qhu-G9 TaxID=3452799 RepID=UPI002F2B8D86